MNRKIQENIYFIILFFINIIWFKNLNYHVLAGDDLRAWLYFANYKFSFINYSFMEAVFNKYRPVFSIIQYVMFDLFGKNYDLYFYSNILLNFLIIILLFKIVKQISNSSNFLAFTTCVIYITCRFSYYNILQLFGFMEGMALLFLLIIVYFSINFYKTRDYKYMYFSSVFYFLIIFTHERYIVLLPFLLLIVILSIKPLKDKIKFCSLFLSSVIINFVLKKFVLHSSFLEGTGGQSIDFNLLVKLKFFLYGSLNLFGINMGEEYLSGLPFHRSSNLMIYLSIGIFLIYFILILLGLIKLFKSTNKENKLILLIFLVLLMSLLLAASITFRQEYRWLLSPYCIFLIGISYGLSKIGSRYLKYILILVLSCLVLTSNIYYKSFVSNVYFVSGQIFNNSVYNETIKKYGSDIRNYSMYIQKNDWLDWKMFFDVYTDIYNEDEKLKINMVDFPLKIKEVDKNKSLFFQLNINDKKLVNITNQYVNPNEILNVEPSNYQYGTDIQFGLNMNSKVIEMKGFSSPENGYTWTLDNAASYSVPVSDPKSDLTLSLSGKPYISGKIPVQRINVIVNGKKLTQWEATAAGEFTVKIPKEIVTNKQINIILELPDAKSPFELKEGADVRKLGFAIGKLSISELP